MDDLSDIKKDLTAIKSVTDEDGKIKAWIDNIEIQSETINLYINTALGDNIVETFNNPSVWSDQYAFVNFINKSNIDIRLVDDIYDVEIRYDPESEDIEVVDKIPKVSEVSISEEIYEILELKNKTIDDKWVECEIDNVVVNNNSVEVDVYLPNTGNITFNYNKPKSWKDKYAIVELCNRLEVNSAEQLEGCKVAISPRSENHSKIEHTPFYNPDYEVKTDRNLKNYKYTLIPISYKYSGIPEENRINEENKSVESNYVSGIIQVIILISFLVVFISAYTSFVGGLAEELSEPVTEITVNEQDESIKLILEASGDENLIVKDNGKKVRVIENEGVSYIHEPRSKSGKIQLVRSDTSEIISETKYNFN